MIFQKFKTLERHTKSEHGVAMVELGLLIALLVVVGSAAIASVGNSAKCKITTASNGLDGNTAAVAVGPIGDPVYAPNGCAVQVDVNNLPI